MSKIDSELAAFTVERMLGVAGRLIDRTSFDHKEGGPGKRGFVECAEAIEDVMRLCCLARAMAEIQILPEGDEVPDEVVKNSLANLAHLLKRNDLGGMRDVLLRDFERFLQGLSCVGYFERVEVEFLHEPDIDDIVTVLTKIVNSEGISKSDLQNLDSMLNFYLRPKSHIPC